MTLDEVLRKYEPDEPDRKLVSRRVIDLITVLGLQVNEATGEIEPRPGAGARIAIPEPVNVHYAGMPTRHRRRR